MDYDYDKASSTDISVTEDALGIDRVLASLSDGRLGQRIIDAARSAVAKNMLCTAQKMQSPVEAEDSAK